MLEAAGWDSNRELEVMVSTGNEVREKSAILIQQDLQKIGIKTKIQTLDFPTLLTNARNGDYDLCFIGSAGSVDPSESVPNVTAGYMNNFAQLSDPTLGQIGESGAKEITSRHVRRSTISIRKSYLNRCRWHSCITPTICLHITRSLRMYAKAQSITTSTRMYGNGK